MKVGNYTVSTKYQDILGRGAYGVVHKATDAEKKTVAAKLYDRKRNPKLNADELKKLVGLQNENIVEVFDFLQEHETFWMFMEFCSNGDLNKFFYKQKLSMHQRLQVMLGVAKGVVYLHSNNIIHRDICKVPFAGFCRVWTFYQSSCCLHMFFLVFSFRGVRFCFGEYL